jgi:hypothetical protein
MLLPVRVLVLVVVVPHNDPDAGNMCNSTRSRGFRPYPPCSTRESLLQFSPCQTVWMLGSGFVQGSCARCLGRCGCGSRFIAAGMLAGGVPDIDPRLQHCQRLVETRLMLIECRIPADTCTTDIIFSFTAIGPSSSDSRPATSRRQRISAIRLLQPDVKIWIALRLGVQRSGNGGRRPPSFPN